MLHTGDSSAHEVLDVATEEATVRGTELAVLGGFRGLPRGTAGRRRLDPRTADGRSRELSLRRAGVQVGTALFVPRHGRRPGQRRGPVVVGLPHRYADPQLVRAGADAALRHGVDLRRVRASSSDPVDALLRAGEDASLIVVGGETRGDRGLLPAQRAARASLSSSTRASSWMSADDDTSESEPSRARAANPALPSMSVAIRASTVCAAMTRQAVTGRS